LLRYLIRAKALLKNSNLIVYLDLVKKSLNPLGVLAVFLFGVLGGSLGGSGG